MSLFSYDEKIVRDLAWAIRSPGILSPKTATWQAGQNQKIADRSIVYDAQCTSIYNSHIDWLSNLNKHPQPLRDWLNQSKSRRLGLYFELLVEFWLREKLVSERLFSHVQVFNGKLTVGEFDYLFDSVDEGEALHWEVAVKLYLLYKDEAGRFWWYGPNGKDRLDLKLSRLFKHQLCLANTPEGRQMIQQLGFNNIRSELLLKGYLFYPRIEVEAPMICAGRNLSNCHLKGWWSRFPISTLPRVKTGTRWLVLDKIQWLSPALLCAGDGDIETLFGDSELMDYCESHFGVETRSLLIAEMIEGEAGDWREIRRGFIVHPVWPFL